ncbi:TAXI family TRAP transporter solute-binding subunit [Celeribacter sp.]|uniref:TAXI family TRAP transporter solute-binding subunit n=1 Tax=Celeribacter sp. TaxID=1890673 RepID=UPI003A8F27C4
MYKQYLAVAAATAIMATQAAAADAIRLGTATEGGVWFVLGNGFAQVLSDELDTTVTPVTTAGSMENARRLSAGGDLTMGLALATSVANGIADGTVNPDKIRVIGAGHGNFMQVVVRAEDGAKSWSEAMASHRTIGVGEPGSAAFEVTTGAIRALGTDLSDIRSARIGHQAQADALKNRDIETMVVTPGIPTGAVVDVMSSIDARMIGGTEAEIAMVRERMPYMTTGIIPAESYNNQPEPVTTVMLPSLMMITAATPDDTAYAVTKAIYENSEQLAKVHSNGNQWTAENALASRDFLGQKGIAYHPGAIRYFTEIGIW